jgi:hypothetical protein
MNGKVDSRVRFAVRISPPPIGRSESTHHERNFHEAAADALLLRVTDEQVMQRLGFHRVEEPKKTAH